MEKLWILPHREGEIGSNIVIKVGGFGGSGEGSHLCQYLEGVGLRGDKALWDWR